VSARTKARKRAPRHPVPGRHPRRRLARASPPRPSAPRASPRARRRGSTRARSSTASIDNRDEIDEQITTLREDWSLERMPAVDRALLRIGVWEVLYNDEVPDRVAIDEAVELATVLDRRLAGFVNGLLAAISHANA
jgi:N utilization substance protein B